MKSDSPNEALTPMSDNGGSTNSSFVTGPSIAPGIPIDDEKTFTMTLKSDGSYTLSSKGNHRDSCSLHECANITFNGSRYPYKISF